MTLSKEEKERYSRHIRIKDFGEEGQLKLKSGRVLVIGSGGLGCPVIQYLVAAGVGQVGIVDGDTVSLSNLQRQILYTENEIGQSKVEIAASKMKDMNKFVDIQAYNEFLTSESANNIFPNYDLVIGCTDSYSTRYLIDKKSIKHNIPFIHGAIFEFEGQLSVFNYKGSPSYSDIFGTQPAELSVPGGVVGAIPGIIGSLMAMEVIKILTSQGAVLSNKILLYNGLKNTFTHINI